MILETVKIIADALEDATYGLAVYLANVPVEAGDSAPATPTFKNQADDADAARKQLPDGDGPWLFVAAGDADQTHPTTRLVSDAQLFVGLTYLIRDTDTANAARVSSYTERALRKFLGVLNGNDGAALRTRNQVQVSEISNIRFTTPEAPIGDRTMSWSITFMCRSRDLWAQA